MFMRHFTLEEAHAVLPLVTEACGRIRTLMAEQQSLRLQLDRSWQMSRDTTGGTQWHQEERARMAQLGEAIGAEIHEVHVLGGMVKGLDPLLVDFPARLDGQTVLLCWREGEERIDYFHTVDGGVANRQLIERAEDFGRSMAH